MSVKVSTGLAAAILGPAAFDQIFLNGIIEIYTGAQPANADAAPTGTLLGHITKDGGAFTPGSPTNGLTFIRTGRYAMKDPSQTWKLKGIATGTAGWFRLLANAPDSGLLSVTDRRLDSAIGLEDTLGDFQMQMPSLAITPATLIEVSAWIFAIPPLGA